MVARASWLTSSWSSFARPMVPSKCTRRGEVVKDAVVVAEIVNQALDRRKCLWWHVTLGRPSNLATNRYQCRVG